MMKDLILNQGSVPAWAIGTAGSPLVGEVTKRC